MTHKCLLALFFSATASFTLAAPIDDATRKTADADRQATSVVAKLKQLGQTLAARQDALNRLLRTLEDAQDRQRELVEVVIELQRRGDSEVVEQTRELNKRRDEASAAQRAVNAARERLAAARRTLDAATAKEKGTFETSPEYLEANQAVTKRQAELEELKKELLSKSDTDAALRDAKQLLTKAEAEVAVLRSASPQDADALAAASARWIDARNRFENALDAFLDRSVPYRDALDNLREARQALATLVSRFEASIASLPGVADELFAVKSAAFEVRSAEEALKSANEAVDRTALALERRKSELTVLRKLKLQSDGEMRQVDEEIRRLQLDLRSINGQLADAIDDATGVRTLLRGVADALRAVDADTKKKK